MQPNPQGRILQSAEIPNGLSLYSRAQDLIQNALVEIISRLNGQLTEGTGEHGSPTGNDFGYWWDNTTPATPGDNFTIAHNLGVVPKSFEIRWADQDARVYQAADVAPTQTHLTLRCTAASARLRIKVS